MRLKLTDKNFLFVKYLDQGMTVPKAHVTAGYTSSKTSSSAYELLSSLKKKLIENYHITGGLSRAKATKKVEAMFNLVKLRRLMRK